MALSIVRSNFPNILVCDDNDAIGVEIRTHQAKEVRCLERSDEQLVRVVAMVRRWKAGAEMLGAFIRVTEDGAPPLYRVIAHGQVPCPADESRDLPWIDAINCIYSGHCDRKLARSASRLALKTTEKTHA
jgi:hypothetical protein